MKSFCFNSEDAIKYGTEEAIVLFHFRYWVATNKSNNAHNHDGRYWLYNSHKGLCELFPFFNEQKCKRLVQSLKDQGAIIVGNYNKSPYDRTNWYTVNDDSSISQNEPKGQSNLTDGRVQNDRPIPITTITNLLLPITRSPGKLAKNSKEVKRDSFELQEEEVFTPEWKDKSSQWYQHYLKSSTYEQMFNSLPESTQRDAHSIKDKERFISFLTANTPKDFKYVDPLMALMKK